MDVNLCNTTEGELFRKGTDEEFSAVQKANHER
jgi:hypothetical protein